MLVHLGVYGFVEMVIFVSILAVGLIYIVDAEDTLGARGCSAPKVAFSY